MAITRSRARALQQSAPASAQLQGQPNEEKEALAEEQARPVTEEQPDPATEEQPDLVVTEQAGQGQGPRLSKASRVVEAAGQSHQRLYSLYEDLPSTCPRFRQSSHGERLLNWLQSIKPCGRSRCQSDTNVQLLPDFYISTPPMSTILDSTVGPPLDPDAICHSPGVSQYRPPAVPKTTLRAVEQRNYRSTLRSNGMLLFPPGKKVPDDIQSAMESIDLCPIEQSEICAKMALHGSNESDVSQFFEQHIFRLSTRSESICRNGTGMITFDIPSTNPVEVSRVSKPTPDLLLGYNSESFTPEQETELIVWDQNVAKFCFLSVDYKGDGQISAGRMWVATNQCLGATATCVNIIRRLREAVLRRRGGADLANKLDQHVFGLTSNGSHAELFVTFAEESKVIFMKLVRGFLLSDAAHFEDLKRCVASIFNWADERQGHIKAAIDFIRAANKRDAAEDYPSSKRQRTAG
ncbi:unnamed protein product [Clonostachys rosea]|uniref:DUF7924 domain-containing protein n=1 Tax=Bionectria ochroleuca TaxID=29856 RepID=A0ABY6TPB7_BIOOC|nr:unnamed protein product [Clonostachys rosea]